MNTRRETSGVPGRRETNRPEPRLRDGDAPEIGFVLTLDVAERTAYNRRRTQLIMTRLRYGRFQMNRRDC